MNRAEADCNAVPCIDRSNAQCQIDQFRFGEMLTRLVVDAVGKGFEALLAFLDCEPAGFALFHPRFSTWLGRPGVYLEDLFVTQAARGKGVGRRLMIRLAAIAVERGWERIDFQVLDWNPARGFYRRRSAGNPRLPISPRWATRVAAPRKPDRLRQT